ncbi:hypothetical protein TRSC58_07575 [Trypanosoma rangeli SC58]|uniref:Uncharacterized protein n=1 Tax=Trypanosoma rangeli SC58 TaxID=429131 RepID=A0A061ISK4_TRYRA|nr:hypothetical protein TRSC58_07575 [Trypanosoma rangeli SC58]
MSFLFIFMHRMYSLTFPFFFSCLFVWSRSYATFFLLLCCYVEYQRLSSVRSFCTLVAAYTHTQIPELSTA